MINCLKAEPVGEDSFFPFERTSQLIYHRNRITTDELEDIESDSYRIPILDLVNAFAVLMKTAALRSSDDFISEIDLGIESGLSLTLKAQKIGNHPWDRG